jgi:hypothetical protein
VNLSRYAEFKKPVLLIQGDSHELIVDHPLQKINNHSNKNVIRLVVPGANLTEAVEVKINSNKKDASEFFTFKRYSVFRSRPYFDLWFLC